jgi:hypothetical protein
MVRLGGGSNLSRRKKEATRRAWERDAVLRAAFLLPA